MYSHSTRIHVHKIKSQLGTIGHLIGGIALPFVLGGAVYVLFRADAILLNQWMKNLEFMSFVNEWRTLFDSPPSWVLYNLPDGLWTFASTYALLLIWKKEDGIQALIWISIPLLLALGLEFGQFFSYLSGSFDTKDLIAYFVGFLLSLVVQKLAHSLTVQ